MRKNTTRGHSSQDKAVSEGNSRRGMNMYPKKSHFASARGGFFPSVYGGVGIHDNESDDKPGSGSDTDSDESSGSMTSGMC